jgi:hypothetical protein
MAGGRLFPYSTPVQDIGGGRFPISSVNTTRNIPVFLKKSIYLWPIAGLYFFATWYRQKGISEDYMCVAVAPRLSLNLLSSFLVFIFVSIPILTRAFRMVHLCFLDVLGLLSMFICMLY